MTDPEEDYEIGDVFPCPFCANLVKLEEDRADGTAFFICESCGGRARQIITTQQ